MSYLHAEFSVKSGFLNQQKEKGKHLWFVDHLCIL